MTLLRRFFALVFALPALTSILHLTPKGVVDGLLLAAIAYLWLPRPDRERLHQLIEERRAPRLHDVLDRARHDLERAFAAPARQPQPAAAAPVDYAPGTRHPFGPAPAARPALPVLAPAQAPVDSAAHPDQGSLFFSPRVDQVHHELGGVDGWPYGPHSAETPPGEWAS